MFKKIIITAALLVAVMEAALAASNPTKAANTVVVPDPAPAVENLHQTRDAKFRACKSDAEKQQLSGSERSAFVANCVKNAPR
jgi:hypothetical protein